MEAGSSAALSNAPIREASMPVDIEARDGAHSESYRNSQRRCCQPACQWPGLPRAGHRQQARQSAGPFAQTGCLAQRTLVQPPPISSSISRWHSMMCLALSLRRGGSILSQVPSMAIGQRAKNGHPVSVSSTPDAIPSALPCRQWFLQASLCAFREPKKSAVL